MKKLTIILLTSSAMGSMCTPQPVTITVQYANSLDIRVAFQAVDSTNTLLENSLISLPEKDGTQPRVAEAITMTGMPPFTFSAPNQLGQDFCVIPTIIGETGFERFVWRVEATERGLECANDQGTVDP